MIKIVFAMLSLLLFISSCSEGDSTQGPFQSPSVDTKTACAKDPANCPYAMVANADQIELKAGTSEVVFREDTKRIDVGGTCYPSLFPKAEVYFHVAGSSDPWERGGPCENGRFGFYRIFSEGLPQGQQFRVELKLKVYNSDGTEVPTKEQIGASYFDLINRPWPTTTPPTSQPGGSAPVTGSNGSSGSSSGIANNTAIGATGRQ